jgi:hypothetical protein
VIGLRRPQAELGDGAGRPADRGQVKV